MRRAVSIAGVLAPTVDGHNLGHGIAVHAFARSLFLHCRLPATTGLSYARDYCHNVRQYRGSGRAKRPKKGLFAVTFGTNRAFSGRAGRS